MQLFDNTTQDVNMLVHIILENKFKVTNMIMNSLYLSKCEN